MAEENKSGDLAPDPVQLSKRGTMASGSYREAVNKDHLQDKASRIGGTHYSLNRPAQASLTRSIQVEELNLERRLDRLPGQAA